VGALGNLSLRQLEGLAAAFHQFMIAAMFHDPTFVQGINMIG